MEVFKEKLYETLQLSEEQRKQIEQLQLQSQESYESAKVLKERLEEVEYVKDLFDKFDNPVENDFSRGDISANKSLILAT